MTETGNAINETIQAVWRVNDVRILPPKGG